MAVLNYATNYEQALDQVYAAGRRFNRLYDIGNRQLRWTNAKTVSIPNISTGGLVDVNRDSMGTFTRNVDNTWETKTLTHDREFRTLVDPMDVDETNMAVTIANITNVFNTEQKIPEMDKYMASKLLSEFSGFGGTPDTTTVLDASNILATFDLYMQQLDEDEVPEEGRIVYVTPSVRKLLKEAAGISREFNVQSGGGNVSRSITRLDEVDIISVPPVRMMSAYDFTSGAIPAAGADQINMILLHPSAVIAPQKYEFVSLDQPSARTGGKFLYYERLYWDVFLYEKKANGLKFNVTPIV